jgi:cytochrome c oxidase subunit 1
VFFVNVLITQLRGKPSGDDPWDARTLEWSIPSPPPHYNFAEIPIVKERDDFWHHKYAENEAGELVPVVAGGADGEEAQATHREDHQSEARAGAHGEPHMPGPSYWPLVASIGIPFIGYGVMFQWALAAIGGVILLVGVYGWALEPGE